MRTHVKLSSCEKPLIYSFIKYMHLPSDEVKKKIATSLPDMFSLIVDSWTSHSTHYLGIMASLATAESDCEVVLMAFFPLME